MNPIITDSTSVLSATASGAAAAFLLSSPVGVLGGAVFGALNDVISRIATRCLGIQPSKGASLVKIIVNLTPALALNLLGYSVATIAALYAATCGIAFGAPLLLCFAAFAIHTYVRPLPFLFENI